MNRQQQIETIFHNFHTIKRAFSHGSRFSSQHFGLTMTQVAVLMMLVHEGRKTMTEITAELGVSKSAATQLLNGLIEQGFVGREQDEADKRVVYVQLSNKGKQHLRRVRERGGQHITEIFELLDDEELAQIEAITTKLALRAKEKR